MDKVDSQFLRQVFTAVSCGAGMRAKTWLGGSPYPRRWAKRKDNLRFSFLFELLPFPCFLIRRRLPTCDRSEIGNGRGFFLPCFSQPVRSVRYRTATHVVSSTQGATYPCRATLWHVVTEGTCEFRRLVQFIFVGAVYHNALSNCAALLSPRGPSLALRAIHLVPPYMIQFVKWFNVYTIMITIYRRAGWPYPAVCKFSCTIKIVGEHIVLPHQC